MTTFAEGAEDMDDLPPRQPYQQRGPSLIGAVVRPARPATIQTKASQERAAAPDATLDGLLDAWKGLIARAAVDTTVFDYSIESYRADLDAARAAIHAHVAAKWEREMTFQRRANESVYAELTTLRAEAERLRGTMREMRTLLVCNADVREEMIGLIDASVASPPPATAITLDEARKLLDTPEHEAAWREANEGKWPASAEPPEARDGR